MIAYATRLEFLRYVYEGGGASEATRQAYVSDWRVAALSSLSQSGVQTSASTNAHSVGFSTLPGWTPNDVLELANWSRGYLEESDVEDSIALVDAPVRRFSTDFSAVRI